MANDILIDFNGFVKFKKCKLTHLSDFLKIRCWTDQKTKCFLNHIHHAENCAQNESAYINDCYGQVYYPVVSFNVENYVHIAVYLEFIDRASSLSICMPK